MNGIQPNDVCVREPDRKGGRPHYVKVILVGQKEYAVQNCDPNGVVDKDEPVRHIARHTFIHLYDKVQK